MSGIHGASWNNKRPCGVALGFQVRKHTVEFHASVESNEARNVLKDDPFGVQELNNGKSRRPEPAVILRASALPGLTGWLTGCAPGAQVHGRKSCEVRGADVSEIGDAREPLGEKAAAPRVDFAEADGAEASGLGGEGEASKPCEEIEVGGFMVHSSILTIVPCSPPVMCCPYPQS
jgi:hypothetical protein